MEYLSASRLKLLSECKKKFYHQYILKDLPYVSSPFAEMGTAAHEALELYRKHYPEMSRKELVQVFKAKFNPDPDFGWLVSQGSRMLYKLDLNKVVLGELVDVEYPFEIDIDGLTVKGVIDKIEYIAETDTLVVTDYKTNKAIEPDKYFTQIAVYDMVMENIFPDSKKEYELFYLRHNKVIPFKFSDGFHKQTQEAAHNVATYVVENENDSGAWTKMEKQDPMCKYCPLAQSCWG
jgi:RecB family exonuclease